MNLNTQTLDQLSDHIQRPTYDRSAVTAGIVHIGVGGFHRSHQALYTEQVLAQSGDLSWGICGVGLREADRKIGDILKSQDHLYTLIERHPDGKIENRIIGSLVDFLLGPDDPEAVLARMSDAAIRIVSLTITEGGYNFDSSTGEFDFENADIVHDLAQPQSPRSVFGYLTESLRRRKAAGIAPFTVQSCDNIQHNGNVARKMLLAFAKRQDAELGDWIEANVPFPNAMVDRITPVTTPADMEYLQTEFDLEDDWPVTCEPFIQWVIEDNFSAGRPPWQDVGAQFVDDVTPYETMKLRLLNAGHSVLGLLSAIHGHATIDDCVADPCFARYLRKFMDEEVTPVLPRVEGIDLEDYKESLIERFGNPNIKDSVARICLESSAKLPVFLIPTIKENLKSEGSIRLSALVIAAWCYYSDKRVDQHGSVLDITDAMQSELHTAASQTESDPLAFLRLKEIFGDLASQERFTDQYTQHIQSIYADPNVVKRMEALLE